MIPSSKVTERQLVPNGIDPVQHWQDEMANASNDDVGRAWVELCRAQLKRLEKNNER